MVHVRILSLDKVLDKKVAQGDRSTSATPGELSSEWAGCSSMVCASDSCCAADWALFAGFFVEKLPDLVVFVLIDLNSGLIYAKAYLGTPQGRWAGDFCAPGGRDPYVGRILSAERHPGREFLSVVCALSCLFEDNEC